MPEPSFFSFSFPKEEKKGKEIVIDLNAPGTFVCKNSKGEIIQGW
jgi:hypothetical protein